MKNLDIYITEKLIIDKNVDKNAVYKPTNKQQYKELIDKYFKEWWDSEPTQSAKSEKYYNDSYNYIMKKIDSQDFSIHTFHQTYLPFKFVRYMNKKYNLGWHIDEDISEKLIIDKDTKQIDRFDRYIDKFETALKEIGYEKNDINFEKVDVTGGYKYAISFRKSPARITLSFLFTKREDDKVLVYSKLIYTNGKNPVNAWSSKNRAFRYDLEFGEGIETTQLKKSMGGHDYYLLTDEMFKKLIDGIKNFRRYKDSFQEAIDKPRFTENRWNDLVYVVKDLFEL